MRRLLALLFALVALPPIMVAVCCADDDSFSEPYYHFKRVIVTRDTDTGISRIEDLERSAVAVQRNSSHHSYLLAFPKISLSLYDSVEAALTAVANGTERAFVVRMLGRGGKTGAHQGTCG